MSVAVTQPVALRRAWGAERLKRETRVFRVVVAGAGVLGVVVAVLLTGLAAVEDGVVPSGGAGLPFALGGFAQPAGTGAVSRFLAPQLGVLAAFLIAPVVARDLRSRILQVQLSTGIPPRELAVAAWLHAARRWTAVAGSVVLGTLVGTATVLVGRGRGLTGWVGAEAVLLAVGAFIGMTLIGALIVAVALVLTLATGSAMVAAVLVLGWSSVVEPVLLMAGTEPLLLPGTHLKALAWGSQHLDGSWGLTVLLALGVVAGCLLVAPAALRARVCR